MVNSRNAPCENDQMSTFLLRVSIMMYNLSVSKPKQNFVLSVQNNVQFLNNVIIDQTNVPLTSDLCELWQVWLCCVGPLVYILTWTFNLFVFPSFWYERSWWRLFLKSIMLIELDVYVLIARIHNGAQNSTVKSV